MCHYSAQFLLLQPVRVELRKIYRNIKNQAICMFFQSFGKTDREVRGMKDEEKKPVFWEAAAPKLPVIRSGHMENRRK